MMNHLTLTVLMGVPVGSQPRACPGVRPQWYGAGKEGRNCAPVGTIFGRVDRVQLRTMMKRTVIDAVIAKSKERERLRLYRSRMSDARRDKGHADHERAVAQAERCACHR